MVQRAALMVRFCSSVCRPAERINVMPYNKNVRKSHATVKSTHLKRFFYDYEMNCTFLLVQKVQ